MKRLLTWGLGLLVLATMPAWAQVPEEQEPPAPPGPARPRDDIFKMIDAYIVSNLQESLSLSDEQFVKLLPLVKRLQTERRGLTQRRIRALGELRRLFDSGSATDVRVTDLLKELKAVEAEEPATLRRNMAAIDAALTPVQQAKYRVLEVEVERRIRELLNQIRQNVPARRRPDRQPQQR